MPRINLQIGNGSAGPGLSLAYGLCLSLAFALRVLAEPVADGVPSVNEKARYEGLRTHSPFSIATATAPAAGPQASFAVNWFVSGIARIGDSDFVTIKSRDQSQEFSLFGRETNSPNSVALVSVTWSDTVGKSTVILRKGTETARLEFNEAELRAAATTSAGTPSPNGPQTGVKRSAMNGVNGRPPPVVELPLGGAPVPVPANAGARSLVRKRLSLIQPPR